MYRAAMWLFFGFLVLGAIGWLSSAHLAFEIVRVLAVACLMLSLGLFIVDYLLAPQAPDEGTP